MEKQADEKYCGDCGQIIKRRAEICPKCGIRQMDPPWAVNDLLERLSSGEYRKSKAAAILFAFFLGSFGAHKYYLGQIGTGILYTVFCWTFIPTLISWVEVILLIAMSENRFHRRFG